MSALFQRTLVCSVSITSFIDPLLALSIGRVHWIGIFAGKTFSLSSRLENRFPCVNFLALGKTLVCLSEHTFRLGGLLITGFQTDCTKMRNWFSSSPWIHLKTIRFAVPVGTVPRVVHVYPEFDHFPFVHPFPFDSPFPVSHSPLPPLPFLSASTDQPCVLPFHT